MWSKKSSNKFKKSEKPEKFYIFQQSQQELIKILPSEAHFKATGKLHISITDSTMNNVIVSNFSSIEELKDALICSCYLPGFSSWKQVPTYNGKPYIGNKYYHQSIVLLPIFSLPALRWWIFQ